MSTKILIKSNNISGKIPRPDELSYAELAINTADGFLFTKKTNNSIVNLTSWQQLHNKPTSFPPSSHTHSAAEINGTAIINSDPRLTDARVPLSHIHGNISNDGRINSTRLISESHNIIVSNDDGDLFKIDQIDPSKVGGVLEASLSLSDDIDNLSGAVLSLENASTNYITNTDPRLSDARVPTSHSHELSDIDNLEIELSNKSNINHNHGLANLNTKIGENSLLSLTSGERNTSIGHGSLQNSTSGNGNTSVGSGSMFTNTIGNSNTGIGGWAGFFNLSGSENVVVGHASMFSNTTGNNNIAIGLSSLVLNTTGINNVVVGTLGAYNNTTGSNNILIGHQANVLSNNLQNCIVFGANAAASVSGDFVLGSVTNAINTSSTVGTAGGASSLPSSPLGYLLVRLNGTLVKIPYYRS